MSGLVVNDLIKKRGPLFTLGPVSLAAQHGECLALVGANGSGKTTLMRCLLATVPWDSGQVKWNGVPVRPNRPTPGVAGLIEEPRFLPRLTGAENMQATFPWKRLDADEVAATLERVGLGAAEHKQVGRYSQGMRQRLGLARVLLAKPSLVVLDEPTNGLDPVGIRWLRSLIVQLRAEGCTVVLSSHMLHEVQHVATSFVMLDAGRVFAAGKRSDLGEATTLEDLYFHVLRRDSR